ncbi:MAG TPA: NTP transferase domain-containing protein, partial [Rhabdaerophilum sp.]|nr:NTP transferase domain-containing protein [Rhabdaerophilum sp.]
MKKPKLAGVVLAGGRATRMGGGDKPLLEIGGRTILARVLEQIARPDMPIVLNANEDPARFAA